MTLDRVLVTGAAGLLGSYIVERLRQNYKVSGFDRVKGSADIPWHVGDVTDSAAVNRAMEGQDAVIHVAAIPNIWAADGETITRVNTFGTWIVLNAAENAGANRLIFCSSDSAAGFTVKEGSMVPPAYLPIDKAHPLRPTDPYGLSKKVGEEMCRSFTDRGKLEVYSIRPVFVAYPESFPEFRARAADPEGYKAPVAGGPSMVGGGPCWHYVDPRDVARAFQLAMERPFKGFDSFVISAATTAAPEPTLERLERVLGRLPEIRDPGLYEKQPFAPLYDLEHAARELDFRAEFDLRPELVNTGGA